MMMHSLQIASWFSRSDNLSTCATQQCGRFAKDWCWADVMHIHDVGGMCWGITVSKTLSQFCPLHGLRPAFHPHGWELQHPDLIVIRPQACLLRFDERCSISIEPPPESWLKRHRHHLREKKWYQLLLGHGKGKAPHPGHAVFDVPVPLMHFVSCCRKWCCSCFPLLTSTTFKGYWAACTCQ